MSVKVIKGLVSVIIPAYNVEKYIEKCLRSVIEQTYKQIEIIVVDDGSIDGTYDRIKEIDKVEDRILFLHQKNKGVSVARNNGLKNANGEYCIFVDGDDFLEKDAIEILVKAICENDSDWVNCQYNRYDDIKGQYIENYNFDIGNYNLSSNEEKLDFAFNRLLVYRIGYEVWNKLFRMSIIRDNAIYFDENSHMGEDLAFNLCYLQCADSICAIPDRLVIYRIRLESAMTTIKKKSTFFEYIHFLYFVRENYRRMDINGLNRDFELIFSRTFDNAKRDMNDIEIAEWISEISASSEERKFIESMVVSIVSSANKNKIEDWYPDNTGRVTRRHYMYIAKELKLLSFIKIVYIGVYGLYRKLRKRNPLYIEKHF